MLHPSHAALHTCLRFAVLCGLMAVACWNSCNDSWIFPAQPGQGSVPSYECHEQAARQPSSGAKSRVGYINCNAWHGAAKHGSNKQPCTAPQCRCQQYCVRGALRAPKLSKHPKPRPHGWWGRGRRLIAQLTPGSAVPWEATRFQAEGPP